MQEEGTMLQDRDRPRNWGLFQIGVRAEMSELTVHLLEAGQLRVN